MNHIFIFPNHFQKEGLMQHLSKHLIMMLAVFVCTVSIASAVELSLSGYLDSDVWSDFSGNIYTNDELDLGTSISFTDQVSANIYATVASGSVPAGTGEPGQRWAALTFDGVDVTISSSAGTISVGDLVYQYGGFSYYLYKRLSMVTPESFVRGVSYTFESGSITQTVLAGAGDAPNTLMSYNVETTGGDTATLTEGEVGSDANSGAVASETRIGLGDDYALDIYASLQSDIAKDFSSAATLAAGTRLEGSIAEMLEFAATLGYTLGYNPGPSESSALTLLVEPTLSLGTYSLAASVYLFSDLDNGAGLNPVSDEFYVYVEPGIRTSDLFGFGLPLEIHSTDLDQFDTQSQFWAVPTCYIYPADGVQWWLWAQTIVPFDSDASPAYAVGSEIIVEF